MTQNPNRTNPPNQKIVHEVPAQHLVAAVLQSDAILMQLQRELYRALPGITPDQLRALLRDHILRPDVIEGEHAAAADALFTRMAALRAQGLSMTQTLRAVTSEDDEDAFRIMRSDKAGSGGSG